MGASSIRKQFMELLGKPILVHTVERFQAFQGVDEIVLVCASEDIADVRRNMVERFSLDKVRRVVVGGPERQDSVFEGLKTIEEAGLVLVHDAVRPCLRPALIDRLIHAAAESGAAILGVPARDTVKEVDGEGRVIRTLDRHALWHVQTPQAFRTTTLRRAFERARAERFYGTDESVLVERLGETVRVVEGDHLNIKITAPEDLILVERILMDPDFSI